jgi:uncharacterized protein YacL
MEVIDMYSKKKFKPLLFLALIGGVWASYLMKSFVGINTLWQLAIGASSWILCYLLGVWLLSLGLRGWRRLNRWLDVTPIEGLLGGTAGLILGVFIALLSSYPLSMIKGASYFMIFSFLICGYLGMQIGSRRAGDVWKLIPARIPESREKAGVVTGDYKVLDTSAIIDGRIHDVCQSKFLEGVLIVPVFVIEELQHIADSSDNLRRNKGRRGLELLSKMQKDPSINIKIVEDAIAEEREVDMKLIRLCKQIGASIITNDYNLNKVAELQGIKVLNLNELTNAVKVVVYPGETMYISILKEGKEPGQGVGYLEDGTMVVVEDAQDELGNNLEVLVTSVFQTAAGRMIFSRKVKEERNMGIYKPNLQGVPIQEVNIYG